MHPHEDGKTFYSLLDPETGLYEKKTKRAAEETSKDKKQTNSKKKPRIEVEKVLKEVQQRINEFETEFMRKLDLIMELQKKAAGKR